MKRVEFIDYDGGFPCLCDGQLTIKVNGEIHLLENILRSGGWITNDYTAEQGPWEIDLSDYPDLKPYKEEIIDVVNENVPYGCCGGCI